MQFRDMDIQEEKSPVGFEPINPHEQADIQSSVLQPRPTLHRALVSPYDAKQEHWEPLIGASYVFQ